MGLRLCEKKVHKSTENYNHRKNAENNHRILRIFAVIRIPRQRLGPNGLSLSLFL